MSGANKKTPWKDGYWGSDLNGAAWIVQGSVVTSTNMTTYDGSKTTTGKWTFGEFGNASRTGEFFWHF